MLYFLSRSERYGLNSDEERKEREKGRKRRICIHNTDGSRVSRIKKLYTLGVRVIKETVVYNWIKKNVCFVN